jgi:hypothetical protein
VKHEGCSVCKRGIGEKIIKAVKRGKKMTFKDYDENWELKECYCEEGYYKEGWCEMTDGVHVNSCKNCRIAGKDLEGYDLLKRADWEPPKVATP